MEKAKINEFSKTLISQTLPTRLYFYELQDRFGQHLYSTFSEDEQFCLPEVQKLFLCVYRKQIPIDKTRFRNWVGLITKIYIQNGIIVYQKSKDKDSLMYTLSPLWKHNFEKMSEQSFSHFSQQSDQEKNCRRTKAIGTLGYMTFVQLKRGFTHRNQIAENTGFNKQRICVVLSIFKGTGIVKEGKESRGALIFRKKVVEILPYLSEYNKKVVILRQQRRELIEKGNSLFQRLKERLNQNQGLGINSQQQEVNKINRKLTIIFKKRELFATEVDYTPNFSEIQPKKLKKAKGDGTNKSNKKKKKIKTQPKSKKKKEKQKEKKKKKKKKKKSKSKRKTIKEKHMENKNKIKNNDDFKNKDQLNIQKDLTNNTGERDNKKFSLQNPKIQKSLQQSLQSGEIKEVNIAEALLSLSPSPKPNPLTNIMNQTTTNNQNNPEKVVLNAQTPEMLDFRKMGNSSQSPFFYSISPTPYFSSSISPLGFVSSMLNVDNNNNFTNLQTPYFQPTEFWELMMKEWRNHQERSKTITNQPHPSQFHEENQKKTQLNTLNQPQPQSQPQSHLKSELNSQQQQQQQLNLKQQKFFQSLQQPQQKQMQTQNRQQDEKNKTQPNQSPFQLKSQSPLLHGGNTQDMKHNAFGLSETAEHTIIMHERQKNKINDSMNTENYGSQINKEVEAKFIPNFSDKWFND
ncbi:drebrin-like protein [Anaeramoeba flamelloides]|uniref:Drebrin-like protein n=1 Tax=Anaeramoeba flamelloides TaxID=1746091 RepID=A0AAV7ZKW8_9EUKA|nr:drebrin-like protein [Anaeramoeba flamelloides]